MVTDWLCARHVNPDGIVLLDMNARISIDDWGAAEEFGA
jgi:hypothetical protein